MTHEQEPQARYSFLEWFADLKAQQTQRQIADIRKGLFRREDKIMLLEGLLYERVRDGEPVEDLIQAIALLQENKIQDDKLYNSATAQVNGVIAFLIAIGLAATVFSYISAAFLSWFAVQVLCRGEDYP